MVLSGESGLVCAFSSPLISILIYGSSRTEGICLRLTLHLTPIRMFWFSCTVGFRIINIRHSAFLVLLDISIQPTLLHKVGLALLGIIQLFINSPSLWYLLSSSQSSQHLVLSHSNSILTFLANRSQAYQVSFVKPDYVHDLHIYTVQSVNIKYHL